MDGSPMRMRMSSTRSRTGQISRATLDERVVRLGFNILTERFEIDGFDRFVEARDVPAQTDERFGFVSEPEAAEAVVFVRVGHALRGHGGERGSGRLPQALLRPGDRLLESIVGRG